jgi:hypothetical protein
MIAACCRVATVAGVEASGFLRSDAFAPGHTSASSRPGGVHAGAGSLSGGGVRLGLARRPASVFSVQAQKNPHAAGL